MDGVLYLFTKGRILTHLHQYQRCHFFDFEHFHHLQGAQAGKKCVQYRVRTMDVEAWQSWVGL